MCVSYTRITGNVKSKHKQYDHWHSQDFSTGGQSEGAKRPSGEMVWDHGREILKNLRIKKTLCTFKDLLYPSFSYFGLSNQWGGGGGGGGGAGHLYPL